MPAGSGHCYPEAVNCLSSPQAFELKPVQAGYLISDMLWFSWLAALAVAFVVAHIVAFLSARTEKARSSQVR